MEGCIDKCSTCSAAMNISHRRCSGLQHAPLGGQPEMLWHVTRRLRASSATAPLTIQQISLWT